MSQRPSLLKSKQSLDLGKKRLQSGRRHDGGYGQAGQGAADMGLMTDAVAAAAGHVERQGKIGDGKDRRRDGDEWNNNQAEISKRFEDDRSKEDAAHRSACAKAGVARIFMTHGIDGKVRGKSGDAVEGKHEDRSHLLDDNGSEEVERDHVKEQMHPVRMREVGVDPAAIALVLRNRIRGKKKIMLVLSLEEEQGYDKVEQDYEQDGHRVQCRAEARPGKKNPASCGAHADIDTEQAAAVFNKVACTVKAIR